MVGVKLSLPTYDVATVTPEQCIIHSDYVSPKIRCDANPLHYGEVELTFAHNPPSGATTVLWTLDHGYDYVPIALAAATYADPSGLNLQGTLPIRPDYAIEFYLDVNATQMRLKIYYDNTGWGTLVGGVLTLSYYIFAESGL
jgi:hypothetical protein